MKQLCMSELARCMCKNLFLSTMSSRTSFTFHNKLTPFYSANICGTIVLSKLVVLTLWPDFFKVSRDGS